MASQELLMAGCTVACAVTNELKLVFIIATRASSIDCSSCTTQTRNVELIKRTQKNKN
jgi:hypothetical protein